MRTTSLLLAALSFSLSGCSDTMSLEELRGFAPTETYPEDTFLNTAQNKRALVVVAHDDDDCAMSGTIAKLTAAGWEVKQLSLQRHVSPNTGENPARIICQGNDLLLEDGYYRRGLDTMKFAYLPVPYEELADQFLTEKIAAALTQYINTFRPSVIFTLDNEKGGYGHPEHIHLSQLVKDLFEDGTLMAERVYQSVYTDHMEREIVDKWLGARLKKWGYPDASQLANELYGISGMPEPTVQVTITEVAETKMAYLRAYEEDVRKNLRKFIPYYEDHDAHTYFSLFDREFFRVLEPPAALDLPAATAGVVPEEVQLP
jgi:LmbE family N-acetylglucosaminyl deacetylase